MIKHVVTDFDIICTQKWTCPDCGREHETVWNVNPYRMMAEDPIDVQCDGCENFFTLSFYNEDWVEKENETRQAIENILNKNKQ